MDDIEIIEEVVTSQKKKKDLFDTVIQIPNSVVKNRGINDKAFLVYYYLKHQSFRAYEDKINLQINHIEMKKKLCIKDNRTLLKALHDIYNFGLIAEYIEKLPIHSLMKIRLNEIELKPFTQLPIGIIDKIAEIESKGLRLLYYYKSFINHTKYEKLYAFPSYDTINKETGLSFETIKKYNVKLQKLKYLKIYSSKAFINADGQIHKFNNKYFLRYDRLITNIN